MPLQKNSKTRNSFARKIITVAFLPIIIVIWIVGWTLTQLGNPGGSIEIKPNILQTNSKFETLEANSKKISNYPINA